MLKFKAPGFCRFELLGVVRKFGDQFEPYMPRLGIILGTPTIPRLNNNLDMLNNQHMDPATEQVLVQAGSAVNPKRCSCTGFPCGFLRGPAKGFVQIQNRGVRAYGFHMGGGGLYYLEQAFG